MKGLKIFFYVLVLTLVAAGSVWASEHGAGGEHHAYPWGNFMLRLGCFAIVVGIIYFAAGKKIAEFFRSRRYNIENELADLDKRKSEAAAKLGEVEKGIANMEQERAKVLADYKAQGEALKQSIIEKAKASAEQIKAQAKMTAEQESKAAIESLRAEMADLVSESAQKLLDEKLTKEGHEKLIDKYLTKVVLN